MSPADIVIKFFGGVTATARATGKCHSAVSMWKTQGEGYVPLEVVRIVLRMSKKKRIPMKAEDLIFGRRWRA